MSIPADHSRGSASRPPSKPQSQNPIQSMLSLPPQWLHMYGDFITKNAHQVSQIESALRSLTYIIPGRFRDAEIASETVHSGVQLLSLYHDAVLRGAVTKIPGLSPKIPSPHTRYTRFWTAKSRLYRRIALLLQIVQYTELLWEMAAKRKGERIRWRVVIVLEFIKAVCRLLLMRVTNSRPLVTPALPEREPIPPDVDSSDEDTLKELMGEDTTETNESAKAVYEREWTMPRTGSSLPSLPNPSDIGSYLMGRVLTADDIKPAAKLLNTLSRPGQTAEILHILAPLVYAIALSRSKNKKSWTPWLIGISMEYAARQLRERGLRSTALENEEWGKRYWAAGWWTMRGAFYENFTKNVIGGVRRRMPSLVSGILEDYEYLWENYYFSTSA
ncbi:peroxisome membrane protein [Annulohypoxylon truncatum]|uniref:peroxisome membrane protein n=1 Tax=Annulohypoxylon truncatum TaxID=327061 RepID=UPI002007D572|nr:peroxisome membrane protein [Annulohypoxylon truncatum]KAI1212015.1 peroxisome membrane protein [Annulohypoxylon truncatum]